MNSYDFCILFRISVYFLGIKYIVSYRGVIKTWPLGLGPGRADGRGGQGHGPWAMGGVGGPRPGPRAGGRTEAPGPGPK